MLVVQLSIIKDLLKSFYEPFYGSTIEIDRKKTQKEPSKVKISGNYDSTYLLHTWVPFSITSGVQILLIFRVTLSLENVISTRNRIFRIIITEETVVMAC